MPEVVRLRSARLLPLLAVIVGVIAMHGLATAHHGAAPLTRAVMAVGDVVDGHALPAARALATAPDTHDCGLLCQGGEHSLALLCAAMLLTAATGVLVLRRRSGVLPRTTGPPRSTRLRSVASLRSIDLVAELCISRT